MPPLVAALAGVIFAFIFGLAVGGARRLLRGTSRRDSGLEPIDDLARDR